MPVTAVAADISDGAAMSMSPTPHVAPEPRSDESGLFRLARQQLELQNWSEARDLLLQLATRSPSTTRYRALLAYARGQESFCAGDEIRAREEWRRALILDPALVDAKHALAARPRPRSWVDRLFGRA